MWIVFTLIRRGSGRQVPYPFLNPANGGYGSVAIYSVAILAFMLLVCGLVVWLGNLRSPAKEASSSGVAQNP